MRDRPQLPARQFLPPFTAFMICLLAMFLTGSRAGVALSLLAMIVAFTLLLRKDLSSRAGIFIALGVGAIVALGLLQLFGGRVSKPVRFAGAGR